MYRNAYQGGLLTVFYSCGSKPLALWDVHIKNGYINKFLDQDIKSTVLEIGGCNVSTSYMICPKGKEVLGITMPFLVLIVKNLKKYFSFEVTVLDDTGTRRRFRVSNFQSCTQILPLCTVMPIGLTDGWNQIQFSLADFMQRAYGKQYVEAQKIKINANIRLRRIYFAERLLPEEELPPEFKLYFPLSRTGGKNKKGTTKERNISKDITAVSNKKLISTPSKIPSGNLQKVDKIASADKLAQPVDDAPAKVIDTENAAVVEKELSTNKIAEPVEDTSAKVEETEKDVTHTEEPDTIRESSQTVNKISSKEGIEPTETTAAENAEPAEATTAEDAEPAEAAPAEDAEPPEATETPEPAEGTV